MGIYLIYNLIQQSTKNYVSIQQSTKRWINERAFIKYYDSIQQSTRGPHFFCGRTHAIKKIMFWMADSRTIQNQVAFYCPPPVHPLLLTDILFFPGSPPEEYLPANPPFFCYVCR
jgi:hypothetical protein